jgi:hypothetical protein
MSCLHNGNVDALESYQYELASDFYVTSCIGFMMLIHIFQRCDYLHLQANPKMREDYGGIHFVYVG